MWNQNGTDGIKVLSLLRKKCHLSSEKVIQMPKAGGVSKGKSLRLRKIAEIPENYIKIEEPIEKSIEKLEKYYVWKPLGIIK